MSKSVETPDYGRWSEKGLPHKGWSYQGVEDLGDLIGACEMCGRSIRYVHYVSHDDVDETLGVGCVCAEHLTEDRLTPSAREGGLRRRTTKLATLMKHDWYKTKKGYAVQVRGFRCTVYLYGKPPHEDWWTFVFSPKSSENGKPVFSDMVYKSLEGAKRACFDKLIEVKEQAKRGRDGT